MGSKKNKKTHEKNPPPQMKFKISASSFVPQIPNTFTVRMTTNLRDAPKMWLALGNIDRKNVNTAIARQAKLN